MTGVKHGLLFNSETETARSRTALREPRQSRGTEPATRCRVHDRQSRAFDPWDERSGWRRERLPGFHSSDNCKSRGAREGAYRAVERTDAAVAADKPPNVRLCGERRRAGETRPAFPEPGLERERHFRLHQAELPPIGR